MPVVGETWQSSKLDQSFLVVSGPESHPGFGEWAAKQFVGHRARRQGDQMAALVGLTKKPADYPYDFVLL